MFDLRVLGVDPGLARCGIAVVDGPMHRATIVDSDVVRTPADAALGDRLTAMEAALDTAIRTHRPAAVAVERVFINSQARTGMGAAQVVGVVHLVAARHGLGVTEYTPSQVKAQVTGVGDADKHQVTFMVQRLLKLAEAPTPADRADAMAVALGHLSAAGIVGGVSRRGATGPTTASGASGRRGAAPAGIPARLAAAMEQAGPGLAAVSRPARRPAAPATSPPVAPAAPQEPRR